MTWRGPFLDLGTCLFVPRLVTWDPETGEFTCVDGPTGFETWQEAEEAGRFLNRRQLEGLVRAARKFYNSLRSTGTGRRHTALLIINQTALECSG